MKKKLNIIKIGRGEYNVEDTEGNKEFPFPVSQWEARQYKQEVEVEERLVNDRRIRKEAMKFINNKRWPQSAYGDLDQFIRNSVYKMYHKDMRAFIKKPRLYAEHLVELDEKNRKAREESKCSTWPIID
jgi:hypothetical protein